jgi:hypothetical protein
VIKATKFYQITVLEEYGVLMALCGTLASPAYGHVDNGVERERVRLTRGGVRSGRHRHIRMYKLDDIFGESRYTGAFARKEPFVKLKNTKFSSHYTTGAGCIPVCLSVWLCVCVEACGCLRSYLSVCVCVAVGGCIRVCVCVCVRVHG